MLVDVAGLTLLQRVAPDDVLGRVFGVLETVFSLAVGLGGAAAPLMIHLIGIRGALVATGALLPVLVTITWPMLLRLDVGVLLPERVALMRGVPFLEPLAEATLERISGLLEPVTVAAGEAVFGQGDAGDRFYLIESGEASVVQDGTEVTRLGEGGYFGEIALVQDIPRTATVRASSDLSLLALDRDEFIAAVTGHAPSREAADAVISSRLSGLRAGRGDPLKTALERRRRETTVCSRQLTSENRVSQGAREAQCLARADRSDAVRRRFAAVSSYSQTKSWSVVVSIQAMGWPSSGSSITGIVSVSAGISSDTAGCSPVSSSSARASASVLKSG